MKNINRGTAGTVCVQLERACGQIMTTQCDFEKLQVEKI